MLRLMPVNFGAIQIGGRYDRPILAKMWGLKGLQAISRGVVTPAGGGVIVLFVTRIKQSGLTQYNDFLSGDLLLWEGEKGHGNDRRIALARSRGDTVHLFYRKIHHSPFEYKGPVELVDIQWGRHHPTRFTFRLLHDQGPSDEISRHGSDIVRAPETEREEIVRARVGQGRFRKALLDYWGGCAVTGAFVPEILRASHVKPWKDSTNDERLDLYNGLLLLPQYDSLFDAGLITFSDDGALLLSRSLNGLSKLHLGIASGSVLRRLDDRHKWYLSYHRSHSFAK